MAFLKANSSMEVNRLLLRRLIWMDFAQIIEIIGTSKLQG